MTQPDKAEHLANSVLWPGFLGTEVPAWLAQALRNGLAGVVYFAQNLSGDAGSLSEEIHRIAPNALIGVDEEGGSVTRLETATGSTLPGAAELGALDDAHATFATGREIGRRVDAVGADVVIGPVADVNTDPRNPVIGVRAFGADSALVARHVVAAVQGIQSTGIAACAKHYPGHGDTHTDSHHDLPRLELDQAELDAVHLPPFTAAIGAGVEAIMTAHIASPLWDDLPATLSATALGRLRTDGFDGVIITDALDMAAIRESVGIGGGAVRALAAGADLLCIGNPTNPRDEVRPDQDERDYLEARDAIVAALRSGRLPRERVAQAGARVARLAAQVRGRPRPMVVPFDGAAISRRALRVQGSLPDWSDAPTRVIDVRRASSLAVDSAASHVAQALAAGGPIVRLDATGAATAEIPGAGEASMQSIVLADRLDEGQPQRVLRDRLVISDPRLVTVNVGLPVTDTMTGTVLTASAASLLAARTAREALVARSRVSARHQADATDEE